jgi:broad specificity phosphatase PhoE
VVAANDAPAALARRVRRENHGGVALVVGHSNTIPAIAAALASRSAVPAMSEDDFGTIYVVSVPDLGRATILQLRY